MFASTALPVLAASGRLVRGGGMRGIQFARRDLRTAHFVGGPVGNSRCFYRYTLRACFTELDGGGGGGSGSGSGGKLCDPWIIYFPGKRSASCQPYINKLASSVVVAASKAASRS